MAAAAAAVVHMEPVPVAAVGGLAGIAAAGRNGGNGEEEKESLDDSHGCFHSKVDPLLETQHAQ